MGVLQHCKPRAEVLQGDLPDALFAAEFGSVVAGVAPPVYQHAPTFFRNTYPTRHLKQILERVFSCLRDPSEPGAVIRLSTGFGGGKSHALITLWHLAHNLHDASESSTRLLPLANRPERVRVVGIDAQKAGSEIFMQHSDAATHSLFGELAYQLGGVDALRAHQALDHPEKQPDEATLRNLLPDEPVLILIDELVVYLSTLSEQGRNNLLALVTKLASVASSRPRTVLVITDPADQRAYAEQTGALEDALRDAGRLDEILSRRATDYDPIGEESASIIATRLFESIDRAAAEQASAQYRAYYERAHDQDPTLIPQEATRAEYAQRIVACYPFHPRLIFTAETRLNALSDFQRSRGVLRMFARIVRDLWERQEDVELITAGEIDWSSDRIRQDLIQRLNRQQFEAVIKADLEKHALELDGGVRGIHMRVASALLLDSLPMDPQSGLDLPDLTLAAARLSDAPADPKEAVERLNAIGWYIYPRESGVGWRFRVEPNLNRIIEERAESVALEDARQYVLNLLQEKWRSGALFETHFFPRQPGDVPDNARLKLVITDSIERARAVCQYERGQELPRRFINAIVALAPHPNDLQHAIARARRLLAAEQVRRELQSAHERTAQDQIRARQLNETLTRLRREVQLETLRAFRIVVLHTGELGAMEDTYLVQAEGIESYQPQLQLRQFLEAKNRLYRREEALDPDRLLQLLRGATPTADDPRVYTARSLHERLLSAPELKLIPDEAFVQRTISKAIAAGKLVLRTGDRVYDAQGVIDTRDGQRRRVGESLPRPFAIDDQTLLTPSESDAAQEWTRLDPAPEPPAPPEPQPSPDTPRLYPEPDSAHTVDAAIMLARERRVRTLRLTARNPQQLQQLTQAAQRLNPQRVTLSLAVGGATSDGATLWLSIQNVHSLTHALKPLERARELCRALQTLDTFELKLDLDSPETDYFADRLEELREQLDGLEFHAAFEPTAEP